jgi:hypothetical protein
MYAEGDALLVPGQFTDTSERTRESLELLCMDTGGIAEVSTEALAGPVLARAKHAANVYPESGSNSP